MQKGGVVDRQLVKGSSLPSDEQRTLLGYASRHPESTLHSTGRRHDAAVLLIHGIGYQNFGETLDYFGKPVAHSLKTLATMASATAPIPVPMPRTAPRRRPGGASRSSPTAILSRHQGR